jgi:hypothetical protein
MANKRARELVGAEKERLGRQRWYHLFGPVLANYATVCGEDEAPNKDCALQGAGEDGNVFEVSSVCLRDVSACRHCIARVAALQQVCSRHMVVR